MTSLTLCAYSMLLFLEYRVFIFPFPINELLFFLVATYFFYKNYESHKTIGALALISGLFALFTNQLFWSFFLDGASLERFFTSGWTDLFRLLFFIGTLFWALLTANTEQGPNKPWIIVGVSVCILSGLFFPNSLLLPLGYALISILFLTKNLHEPFGWLWVLLTLLEAGKTAMLL